MVGATDYPADGRAVQRHCIPHRLLPSGLDPVPQILVTLLSLECFIFANPCLSARLIHITFKKDPPIDSMNIIHLIQKNKHIKLAGNEKLRIERELKDPKDRAQMVRDVLRSLGQPKAQVAQPA